MTTQTSRRIAVYGAYGHTGRFVVTELLRRGFVPVACGRDAAALEALATATGAEVHTASADDAAALDAAFAGTAAVLHCAGPFLDTAKPVLDAALRARIHYLDVAAEQRSVADTLARDAEARAAGVTVVPAMAFYGGLADLLATAALDGATDADAIDVAVALDGWHPTRGTRLTGDRNHYPRTYIEHGETRTLPDPAPVRETDFPAPFGRQETVLLTLTEAVVIPHHLACRNLHAWMNLAPLRDLRDPATPPPVGVDDSGRSAQRFVIDVRVRRGRHTGRATASGHDIYAVTAPLLVEALQRILDGRVLGCGVLAPGQAFDARDFLAALAAAGVVVAFEADEEKEMA
ncbi:saccharopine dehydrogenase NADP-binding domain-containing protein [Rhodanobacter sp. 7MK24]|uniref:saccharopine dehydrogenase NADP-binding domain-containing protein n=1 Tax=Rhodanobacter sp. 7MK24 TaxID=2775922 RepID=UPI00177C5B30|nr:saccharopine dehydrogenase NADP-binding domain-containing protein [Rhodanobacter sp. 7MK24]MBD8879145.1 saccharopine dehydrogenase NADP-binding domain-containing protein [Rhodanobacter sp. 7MK24]